jgi:hypothetical protein
MTLKGFGSLFAACGLGFFNVSTAISNFSCGSVQSGPGNRSIAAADTDTDYPAAIVTVYQKTSQSTILCAID